MWALIVPTEKLFNCEVFWRCQLNLFFVWMVGPLSRMEGGSFECMFWEGGSGLGSMTCSCISRDGT